MPHLGAGIIVWPEAALPALESDLRDYLETLQATARAQGSDVVMGLLRRDRTTGAFHNSMVALGATEQWYDKRRLVPFGEFFPVPAAVRDWLRLMNLPYSDFVPGAATRPRSRRAARRSRRPSATRTHTPRSSSRSRAAPRCS